MKALPLVLGLVALAGCGRGQNLPVYQDEQGFRLVPPPGWSERARPAIGAGGVRKKADLPLPPLGVPGAESEERLLVRYDRLTAGRLAWLLVTTADIPESVALDSILAGRAPRPDWRREGNVETREVAGRPAARLAFTGRWDGKDYLCEIVAVRKGKQVNFIAASFPAGDEAREQVRQAVAAAVWK
jgi:hypothetical protein